MMEMEKEAELDALRGWLDKHHAGTVLETPTGLMRVDDLISALDYAIEYIEMDPVEGDEEIACTVRLSAALRLIRVKEIEGSCDDWPELDNGEEMTVDELVTAVLGGTWSPGIE